MSTIQESTTTTAVRRGEHDEDPVARWLPLAGAAYAVLMIVGTLVIDQFPDENTSTSALVRYYAAHHAQVQRGGEIATLGCLFFGLFAAGLFARARRHPSIAAVIALGAASELAVEVQSNSTYTLLGSIGHDSHIDPAALQAWHIGGAAFGSNVPIALFLVGIVLAALVGRTLPGWVGWTALVLGALSLVPGLAGFFASLLLWPWALAVGVALTVRGRVGSGAR